MSRRAGNLIGHRASWLTYGACWWVGRSCFPADGPGGELFEYLLERGPLREDVALHIMKQVRYGGLDPCFERCPRRGLCTRLPPAPRTLSACMPAVLVLRAHP